MTQDEFDKQFVGSAEIARTVGVSIAAVWYARERGALPGAIFVTSQVCIWDREFIAPSIAKWILDRAPVKGIVV
jgi:hypothetical protein